MPSRSSPDCGRGLLVASNVPRGQRALQMIGGVTLSILIGIGVEAVLGSGAVAIGVAVLIALTLAVDWALLTPYAVT